MEELISVIVPIYNVEKYLDRCVQSIIEQTYKNIEIILVDDGAQDNCPQMCDEYAKKDKRIKVIHKENGGLSDARNTGIEKANGKLITLIDSDDYVTNDYVEALYNLLKENDVDMSIIKHNVVYSDGTTLKLNTNQKYIMEPKEAIEKILYGEDLDLTAVGKLYKKELFNDTKFPKGRLFEDAATTYKIIDKCNKIAFESVSKYTYYIRKDSITTKEFNPKKMDLIISTKEMADYVKGKYPELEKAADRRLMYAYLSTLTQLAKSKNSNDYKSYRDEMMTYISKNRKRILKDKRIPKRDRIALNCTKIGYGFFKFSWNVYENITNRK